MPFSDRQLQRLKPKNSTYDVNDNSDVPGFHVRVARSGKPTFYLRYSWNNERQKVRLGQYRPSAGKGNPSNLIDRRNFARKLRELLNQTPPVSPKQFLADQKRQQQETKITQGSLGDLITFYLKTLEGRRSHTAASNSLKLNILGFIDAAHPANAVTPDMVADALAKVHQRGAVRAAAICQSYLRAAFAKGLKHDTDPAHRDTPKRFYLTANPVEHIAKPKKSKNAGTRNLSFPELTTLWLKLDRYEGMEQSLINALQLLLLTGQRVEQLLGAPIEEFDLKSAVWIIPADRMKSGRAHAVPLHSMVISVIQAQIHLTRSLHGKQVTLLFPNRNDIRNPMPSTSLGRAVARFCVRTDFEKFTPRDIRRTWKSRSGEIGITLFDRDLIQAHARYDSVSRNNYDHANYLPQMTDAMNKWCQHFQQALKINAAQEAPTE